MNMRAKLSLCSLVAGLSIASICVFSNKRGSSFITYGNHTHVGYHYDAKMNTETEPGHLEFWTCCTCHEVFLEEPEGEFADQDDENMSGGLTEFHPAYLAPRDIAIFYFDYFGFYDDEETEFYVGGCLLDGDIQTNDLIGLYLDDDITYIRVKRLYRWDDEEELDILVDSIDNTEDYITIITDPFECDDSYCFGIAGDICGSVSAVNARYFVRGYNEISFHMPLIRDVYYLALCDSSFERVYQNFCVYAKIDFDKEVAYESSGYCSIEFLESEDGNEILVPEIILSLYLDYEESIGFYITDDETSFEYCPGIINVSCGFTLKSCYFKANDKLYSDVALLNEISSEPEYDSRFALYISFDSRGYYGYSSTMELDVAIYYYDENIYPRSYEDIISTDIFLYSHEDETNVMQAHVCGYKLSDTEGLTHLQLRDFKDLDGNPCDYTFEFDAVVAYYE